MKRSLIDASSTELAKARNGKSEWRPAGYSSKLEMPMINAKSNNKEAKRHLETRQSS